MRKAPFRCLPLLSLYTLPTLSVRAHYCCNFSQGLLAVLYLAKLCDDRHPHVSSESKPLRAALIAHSRHPGRSCYLFQCPPTLRLGTRRPCCGPVRKAAGASWPPWSTAASSRLSKTCPLRTTRRRAREVRARECIRRAARYFHTCSPKCQPISARDRRKTIRQLTLRRCLSLLGCARPLRLRLWLRRHLRLELGLRCVLHAVSGLPARLAPFSFSGLGGLGRLHGPCLAWRLALDLSSACTTLPLCVSRVQTHTSSSASHLHVRAPLDTLRDRDPVVRAERPDGRTQRRETVDEVLTVRVGYESTHGGRDARPPMTVRSDGAPQVRVLRVRPAAGPEQGIEGPLPVTLARRGRRILEDVDRHWCGVVRARGEGATRTDGPSDQFSRP
jgi:hypothetical protein